MDAHGASYRMDHLQMISGCALRGYNADICIAESRCNDGSRTDQRTRDHPNPISIVPQTPESERSDGKHTQRVSQIINHSVNGIRNRFLHGRGA